MSDPDLLTAVRWAFRQGHLAFTEHAYIRMRMERLSTSDVGEAGAGGELLEDYPDRPEGHTLLMLGYARSDAVHVVANVSAYSSDWNDPVLVVTSYRPEPPDWLDERTRRRRSERDR